MSDEITEKRSPRAPGSSLQDAIETVRKLYQQARTTPVKPETAVKVLGYESLKNGAALGTLGTLSQYGLVERTGGNVTVTELAVKILHPVSPEQKERAIKMAAQKPRVFAETLRGHENLSEEVMANHLIHNNFTPERAKKVAQVYAANKAFAKLAHPDLNENELEDADEFSDNEEETIPSSPPTQPQLSHLASQFPTTPTTPTTPVTQELPVPVGDGMIARIPFPLTEDDFDLLIGTLNLWKKRIVKAAEKPFFEAFFPNAKPATASRSYPCQAVWKNVDHDAPVTIVGEMGERDGVKYYQSATGTGIPGPELTFA